MNKITPNRFLSLIFCLAIFYQLFCTSFIAAENNTDIMKIDSVFNTSNMFSISEQTVNVEHFKRPNTYRLSKVGKDFTILYLY